MPTKPLPSPLMLLLPGALILGGGALCMVGASGEGIHTMSSDGGVDVSTWPVILGGLASLVSGIGVQASQYKTAALSPPVDKDGSVSANYTCSIALGQAHREGNQPLVDLLSKTVKTKKETTVES